MKKDYWWEVVTNYNWGATQKHVCETRDMARTFKRDYKIPYAKFYIYKVTKAYINSKGHTYLKYELKY